MTGAVPIFLARYSAGAGHYNAIIPDQTDHQDPNTPSSTSLSMASSNPTANEKLSCRCNGSKRKKFTKYKKRCDCIREVGWCQASCKCDGKCGESGCKWTEEEITSQKLQRSSRKRASHNLQKFSPQKGKNFLSAKENKGPLNLAEHFFIAGSCQQLTHKKRS